MSGGGGPRIGAGRPRGSKNNISKAAIKAAKETGVLPHEWLLSVARGDAIEQKRLEIVRDEDGNEIKIVVAEMIYPDIGLRMEAAKAAAPYYAPRLATQTVSVQGGNEAVAEALKLMAMRLPV